MIGVYAFLQMTGANGVAALIEKRAQVNLLQEQNAELERSNRMRNERIERLLDSREEQELEIRRRFKLQKKDSVDFYLPPNEIESNDQPAGDSSNPATTP
jgi:cell division protein FtsB